jgi:hypothetical protein
MASSRDEGEPRRPTRRPGDRSNNKHWQGGTKQPGRQEFSPAALGLRQSRSGRWRRSAKSGEPAGRFAQAKLLPQAGEKRIERMRAGRCRIDRGPCGVFFRNRQTERASAVSIHRNNAACFIARLLPQKRTSDSEEDGPPPTQLCVNFFTHAGIFWLALTRAAPKSSEQASTGVESTQ